jgi:O-antigen/teichoic acid export membrane protein
MGKNKEVFISMLAGLVISIISNFILVPILKDKGTAISTVITEIIVTGLYLHFVKQFFQMNYQFKLILQTVALAILFIPIILLTRSTIPNVFIMTIVSIFTCITIYFGFQHFIFNNKTIYQFMFLKNEKTD